MSNRISNSWKLVKASAAVLKADKELIVFPIISTICILIVIASFAIPSVLSGLVTFPLEENPIPPIGFVVGFLFYLSVYFVAFFFNSALVGAAMIRLRGGDPTVNDGLRIATQRMGAIFGYALISATVGMILQALSERLPFMGKIVISMIGMAWGLATHLVVPVLVVEGVGPVEGVRRGGELLKKTWGEQIVGNHGIGIIFVLVSLGVSLASIPIIGAAITSGSQAMIVLSVSLLVLLIVMISLLSATLGGIYSAAVYLYAVGGKTSGFFSQELVQGAFRSK